MTDRIGVQFIIELRVYLQICIWTLSSNKICFDRKQKFVSYLIYSFLLV